MSAADDRSFFLFSRGNPVRRLCLKAVHSFPFTFLSNLVIFTNVVLLAFAPKDGETAQRLDKVDLFFQCFYTIELLLRMVSDGVVSPSSTAFLRSGWGVLDFILVSLGWLPHIINGVIKINNL